MAAHPEFDSQAMKVWDPMTERKQSLIVNISLSDSERDYDHSVEFLGGSFRIIRMGTGGNVKRAIRELHTWSGRSAAIGIGGVHDAEVAGTLKGDRGKLRKAAEESAETVVAVSHQFNSVLQEWTIRHLAGEMPGYFSNARVVVLGGRNHYRTAVLSESTQNMHFADPAVEYGLSDIHTPFEVFERVVSASGWLLEKLPSAVVSAAHRRPQDHRDPGSRGPAELRRRGGHLPELAQFELDDLKGKTLISTSIGSSG